jgi:hypothetical protein
LLEDSLFITPSESRYARERSAEHQALRDLDDEQIRCSSSGHEEEIGEWRGGETQPARRWRIRESDPRRDHKKRARHEAPGSGDAGAGFCRANHEDDHDLRREGFDETARPEEPMRSTPPTSEAEVKPAELSFSA